MEQQGGKDQSNLRTLVAVLGLIRLVCYFLFKRRYHSDDIFWPAFGDRLAVQLETLGGAYVKAGQILATREDLFPHEVLVRLHRLRDRVKPMKDSDAERIVRWSVGSRIESVFSLFDVQPFASGSVAQVHRAVLAENGKVVAVKIKRAGIDRVFERDGRVLRWLARFLATWPTTRETPLAEGLAQVASALMQQTDFVREATVHRLVHKSFYNDRDVLVPGLVDRLCTPTLIVMEYFPSARCIGDTSSSFADRRFVVTALRALYRMIFTHGLVHCDMHPGNVLVADDGRLILLDFGFAATISETDRHSFAELFLSLAVGDAEGAAAIVCKTAALLPADLDILAFNRDIRLLVNETTGKTAREFLVTAFVQKLFAIQREHSISGSPAFTMAILSLVAFEGTIRNVYPELDFQREALPFVMACVGEDWGRGIAEPLPPTRLPVLSDFV